MWYSVSYVYQCVNQKTQIHKKKLIHLVKSDWYVYFKQNLQKHDYNKN